MRSPVPGSGPGGDSLLPSRCPSLPLLWLPFLLFPLLLFPLLLFPLLQFLAFFLTPSLSLRVGRASVPAAWIFWSEELGLSGIWFGGGGLGRDLFD